MIIAFSSAAWDDYLYWQKTDRAVLKKINRLITAISRNPYEGIGKPEALRFDYTGFWSRRITEEHRLVYTIENNIITIAQCRYHYK